MLGWNPARGAAMLGWCEELLCCFHVTCQLPPAALEGLEHLQQPLELPGLVLWDKDFAVGHGKLKSGKFLLRRNQIPVNTIFL